MRKFDYAVFDLDGTLTRSDPGITKSAQYALEKLGVHEPDASRLTFFIGPPLNFTLMTVYGMDEEKAAAGVKYFRERYGETGLFENEPYPGVPEMLKALKEAGIMIAVASSKPEKFVIRILDHFGMTEYFDVIKGSTDEDELRQEKVTDNKTRVLTKALSRLLPEENREAALARTAMVGDRKFDIAGGIACGAVPVGVQYGYGARQELEEAGAVYITETVEELKELLLS